jgi:hypothetical protein
MRGFTRGNARHPAQDQPAVGPVRGAGVGSNTAMVAVPVSGPSVQSIRHAQALGLAVNTASPMSRGMRVWAGDNGYGVHRCSGPSHAPHGDPAHGAIAPVATPDSVRYGMQSGPSQPAGYPSTGLRGDFGAVGSPLASVAALDMRHLSSLGYGS